MKFCLKNGHFNIYFNTQKEDTIKLPKTVELDTQFSKSF